MTEQAWPQPVPKLDAIKLLRELNASTGMELELLGNARGGEVGAAFVRWPGGREGVLTQLPPTWNVAGLRRDGDILRFARGRGVPCPQYQLVHELPDGVAVIQERLPGHPPRQVDDGVIDAMLAINDQFAHLLVDHSDAHVLGLYLDRSGPGFCIHETLAQYDHRTRRLLDWIREVGNHPSATMTGDDLVHADFHPGNVLVDETGRVTGVVDWDGVSRGDRRFGLVTLAFDLDWRMRYSNRHEPLTVQAKQRVAERLNVMEPDTLRVYWAHMSLRMVDWSIRHHSTEVVDHYLAFASSRFDIQL